MPIEANCPHCEATYKLPDSAAGKKFRCKECEEVFAVEVNGKEQRIQAKAAQRKPAAVDDDDDAEDEEEEAPKEKKKKKKGKKGKKKQASSMPLIIGAGAGGLLVLVIIVYFVFFSGSNPPPAPVADPGQQPEQQQAEIRPVAPPVDPNDPVARNLERLRMDQLDKQQEILAAVDFFKNASTAHPRDPKADHPLRGEVSKALELLIDHQFYKVRDDCWAAWTRWITEEDIEAINIHIKRAPNGNCRMLIMQALERIKTEDTVHLLALCLMAPERDAAVRHLEKVGPPLAVQKVAPFVYDPEEENRELAFAILAKLKVERASLPRLPPADDSLSLDGIAMALGEAETMYEGPGWYQRGMVAFDPIRIKKLAALGWLQKQLLSAKHWPEISAALDPLVSSEDQYKRVNALLCLQRWATQSNISALSGGLGNSKFKKEHHLMVEILTKIPDPQACITVMDLLPTLDPALWPGLADYMKSQSSIDAMKAVLAHFNNKEARIQAMARAAVQHYRATAPQKFKNDDIIERCMVDVAGEPPTQIAALTWLNSNPLPSDPKMTEAYRSTLEGLTSSEVPAVKAAATSVFRKYGGKLTTG